MGSVAKRRCARGRNCYHVRNLGLSEPVELRTSREGDMCDKCRQENKGALQSSNNSKWIDVVLEAIQSVRSKCSQGCPIGKASLWDLFDVDDSPRWGRPSDLGEVLSLLDAKTQAKLVDWLDTNVEEAVGRYGERRCHLLYSKVRVGAGIKRLQSTLPFNELLVPEQGNTGLPLAAMAYTRSGRGVDQTVVIRLALLRRERRFFSERDLERELGVPRSTLKHMMKRMDEIGFSLEKFTSEDLNYITRGPRHESQDIL